MKFLKFHVLRHIAENIPYQGAPEGAQTNRCACIVKCSKSFYVYEFFNDKFEAFHGLAAKIPFKQAYYQNIYGSITSKV